MFVSISQVPLALEHTVLVSLVSLFVVDAEKTYSPKDCENNPRLRMEGIICGNSADLGKLLPLKCAIMDKTVVTKPDKEFKPGDKSNLLGDYVKCVQEGYKCLKIVDKSGGNTIHRVCAEECNGASGTGSQARWITKSNDNKQYGIFCDANPLPTVIPFSCRFRQKGFGVEDTLVPGEYKYFEKQVLAWKLRCDLADFAKAKVTVSLSNSKYKATVAKDREFLEEEPYVD